MAKRKLNCQLVITDPDLLKVLDRDTFESYVDFTNSFPFNRDIVLSIGSGVFVGRINSFGARGSIFVLNYSSFDGIGDTTPDGILGFATQEMLEKYKGEIDPKYLSSLIESKDESATPNTPEALQETQEIKEEANFNPSYSKIAYKKFEKTTGQDVESEENQTLKSDDTTAALIELKDIVATDPNPKANFRIFIIPNQDGVADEGLVVVDSFAYETKRSALGRELTAKELFEISVNTSKGQVLIPLEGASPLSDKKDDTFFGRGHDARLDIAVEKLGFRTKEEADNFYKEGRKRLRDARNQSHSQPVEVLIDSVSQGNSPEESLSKEEFQDKYELDDLHYEHRRFGRGKDTYSNVVLVGRSNGREVSVPVKAKTIEEVVGRGFLSEIIKKYLNNELSPLEKAFLSSLFISKRFAGKISFNEKGLFFGTELITSEEDFFEKLSEAPYPSFNTKSKIEQEQVIYKDGQLQTVSGPQFLDQFTETDGGLWKQGGVPVSFKANRFIYIGFKQEIKPTLTTTHGMVGSQLNEIVPSIPELYNDPSPRAALIRSLFPRLFTPEFLASLRFKHYVSGAIKSLNLDNYFTRSNLSEFPLVIKSYIVADLISMVNGETKVPSIDIPDIYDLFVITRDTKEEDILKQVDEMMPDIEALVEAYLLGKMKELPANKRGGNTKLRLINELIKETEDRILFGVKSGVTGNSPTTSVEYWENVPTQPSIQGTIGGERLPSHSQESLLTDEDVVTLDTYRDIMMASGLWTNEMEEMYRKELKGEQGFNKPLTLEFAYNSPRGVNFTAKSKVLVPSQLSESEQVTHRALLVEGAGFGFKENRGTILLPYMVLNPKEISLEDERDISMLTNLESSNIDLSTPEFRHAVKVLGRKWARMLFAKHPNTSKAEINRLAKHHNVKTPATEFIEFPMQESSKGAIKSGLKTVTARQVGLNPQGVLEIDGEKYDVRFQGNLNLQESLKETGMTQDEFIKNLTGNPEANSESIFDPGMLEFLNGSTKRAIFTFHKLGASPKVTKTKEEKVISCRII